MRILALLPGALALAATTALAQNAAPEPKTPIDWTALRDETVRNMQEYLRINTTNPPGNELLTARWLKNLLE